jgi:hypothetical protein
VKDGLTSQQRRRRGESFKSENISEIEKDVSDSHSRRKQDKRNLESPDA